MTQTIENLKGWNPYEITIPNNLSADENLVSKVISSFQTDGVIPNIVVNESGELVEGVESLEAAKRLEQKMVMVVIASSAKPQINIKWIPIELLDPHPINAQIYGESEDVTALAESITLNGLQEIFTLKPVDNRYTTIHGHRRRLACLKAGIKVVPAKLENFPTMEDEIAALLAGNEYREKTIEQKSREYLVWLEIEKERAKSRCGRPGEGQGATRDIIAKRVGLGSGVNAEHAIACVKTLDETKGAPDGSVRHQQHEQLKQLLSRTRGVDAAYKLIKPEPPPNKTVQRWTPKEFERVKIINGPHKGAIAVVRIITGPFSSICYIEGDPEDKRHQIAFNQMEALPTPPTSVTQELNQKQQSLGFGSKRSQLLPEVSRNVGPPVEQQSSSITNLNATGDVLVTEVAIALLKLTSKQLHEVMCKVQPELSGAQLEAIWKALEKSLAHKAA
ncbi:ParB N-terminal domain-containing protein [Nostoc sp. JL23]|uniref:ParB/RepB/Spo0J family partition protein n=1 Tax=Nostoc sp. JL23 TaxID=2815394 RepID=UPI001D33753E|nr:ParB N-terminal domain-containing protein [Nostoc sp. JL23]MBN3875267.1 ParB N-terminal domain-containing protein [Nostoc sp. JL23]